MRVLHTTEDDYVVLSPAEVIELGLGEELPADPPAQVYMSVDDYAAYCRDPVDSELSRGGWLRPRCRHARTTTRPGHNADNTNGRN
jgi:hypothetical protein